MNPNFTRCITRLNACSELYNSLGDDPICRDMGVSPYSEQSNRRHERQLLEIVKSEGYEGFDDLAKEARERGVSSKWLHFHVEAYLPYYESTEPLRSEFPDEEPSDLSWTDYRAFSFNGKRYKYVQHLVETDYGPELKVIIYDSNNIRIASSQECADAKMQIGWWKDNEILAMQMDAQMALQEDQEEYEEGFPDHGDWAEANADERPDPEPEGMVDHDEEDRRAYREELNERKRPSDY